MKYYITSLFALLFISVTSYSQPAQRITQVDESSWPANRLGALASSFMGYGLSYQRHFPGEIAARIAMFGFGESNNTDKSLYGTLGLDLQYTLHRTKYTRFHTFVASSIWYDESNFNYIWDSNYYSSSINRSYVFGFGFGFEFLAWQIISFSIETGLQGRFENNSTYNKNNNMIMYENSKPRFYGFGFGGGISYSF